MMFTAASLEELRELLKQGIIVNLDLHESEIIEREAPPMIEPPADPALLPRATPWKPKTRKNERFAALPLKGRKGR